MKNPKVRYAPCLGPAKGDEITSRRLGAPEIPDPFGRRCQERGPPGLRVDRCDGGAAARLLGLELTVEVIDVGTL